MNVFLLLRLERKLASKAFTAPHHRPDPDAAPEKTPLEIAEEKREALKFLAGYRMLQMLSLKPILRIKSCSDSSVGGMQPRGIRRRL